MTPLTGLLGGGCVGLAGVVIAMYFRWQLQKATDGWDASVLRENALKVQLGVQVSGRTQDTVRLGEVIKGRDARIAMLEGQLAAAEGPDAVRARLAALGGEPAPLPPPPGPDDVLPLSPTTLAPVLRPVK